MKGATVAPNGSEPVVPVFRMVIPMTTRKRNSKTDKSVATVAANALANLESVTSTLPIDDAIPANMVDLTKVANRVPVEAMTIASTILNNDPKSFPQFDGAEVKASIEYEQTMMPVADAAQLLANRIVKSVRKRKSGAAQQTLALYQVVKGTSRLSTNEETRTQVKQLSNLLTTRRKSRETEVTQNETQVMVKTRKSAKKQAVAQQKAAEASTEAAIAAAQATLDAAVAAGTVPAATGAATPVAVAAPAVAPGTTPVAGTSGH
jgi:hypothetical protein